MFSEIMTIAVFLFAIYGLTTSAGILSERSGIVNLSLNGYLMVGALGSLIAHSWMGRGNSSMEMGTFLIDFGSMFVGGLFAMVISILFSIASINLKGDQVVVGTALNLLIASVVFVIRFADKTKMSFTSGGNFNGSVQVRDIPVGFDYFSLYYLFLTIFIIALLWLMIRYTKLGLRIWASGENPNALEASGVNVYSVRWITQFMVSFLAGMAGGIFVVYGRGLYSGNVEGIGFIALAFIVLSQWRLTYTIPIVIVFAVLQAWLRKNLFEWSHKSPGLDYAMAIIPFAIPLVILPFVKRTSNMPQHDGQIYDRAKR